jgi:hypothetical protein
MSSHNDEVRGRELAMTWELDLDYLTIARFTDLVLERSLEHTAYTSWATERMTLEGLLERALYSLRDRSERAAVIDLSDEVGGECLVHVSLERGRAYVRAATELSTHSPRRRPGSRSSTRSRSPRRSRKCG